MFQVSRLISSAEAIAKNFYLLSLRANIMGMLNLLVSLRIQTKSLQAIYCLIPVFRVQNRPVSKEVSRQVLSFYNVLCIVQCVSFQANNVIAIIAKKGRPPFGVVQFDGCNVLEIMPTRIIKQYEPMVSCLCVSHVLEVLDNLNQLQLLIRAFERLF